MSPTLEPSNPSPPGLRCEVTPERDAVRLRPVGELDLGTVPILDAQISELREAGFRRVCLDLRDLAFMDASGLHLVLRWDAEARRDGFAFEMVPGPRAVQMVFEVSGVVARLPFVGA
jgi:anti-anti-sigma factor